MKILLRAVRGDYYEYKHPFISVEKETRHVVQLFYPFYRDHALVLGASKEYDDRFLITEKDPAYFVYWKRFHLINNMEPPRYTNIEIFDDRLEWDYTSEVYYLNVNTVEELIKFSEDIEVDLILETSREDEPQSPRIIIYDGYID